jgi:hypothetical protein
MRKTTAVFLGFLTLIPTVYVLLLMFDTLTPPETGRAIDRVFDMLPIPIIGVLVWGLILFDMFYAFKTSYVPKEKRLLWCVVLVLAHAFALPFFWYLYVWRPAARTRGG